MACTAHRWQDPYMKDEVEQVEGGTEPGEQPDDLLAHEGEDADRGGEQERNGEALLRALMAEEPMANLQPKQSPTSASSTPGGVSPAEEQQRKSYRRLAAAGFLRKQPPPYFCGSYDTCHTAMSASLEQNHTRSPPSVKIWPCACVQRVTFFRCDVLKIEKSEIQHRLHAFTEFLSLPIDFTSSECRYSHRNFHDVLNKHMFIARTCHYSVTPLDKKDSC